MVTTDYVVVMPVLSIRFADAAHHERLKVAASRRGSGMSPLAEELIEEGLRMREHPQVIFRDGPSGRRAALVHGPEIVDVVGSLKGGDLPAGERRARAAEHLSIPVAAVDAALDYYGDFADEIDAELDARLAAADELEARWRRGQHLLSS